MEKERRRNESGSNFHLGGQSGSASRTGNRKKAVRPHLSSKEGSSSLSSSSLSFIEKCRLIYPVLYRRGWRSGRTSKWRFYWNSRTRKDDARWTASSLEPLTRYREIRSLRVERFFSLNRRYLRYFALRHETARERLRGKSCETRRHY